MSRLRGRALRLDEHEARALADLLGALARAADLVPLLSSRVAVVQDLEAAAWLVACSLPASIHAALLALAADRLDYLIIDDEPERTDLPGTWEGVCRNFAGGLMADWLGLAYAFVLGARKPRELGFDQLSLAAQLGSDGLHRDTLLYAPGDESVLPAAGRWPQGWTPRYLACRYSSLRCIRPGTNPDIVTVLVSRDELVQQLEAQLELLSQPIFRCELLAASGFAGEFAVLAPTEEGSHELTAAAINSSLVLEQRSHGAKIHCPSAAAAEAIAAFDRARVELHRYELGTTWRAGRRLILNQRRVLHGRRGAIRATSDAEWACERWLVRCNVNPSQPAGLVEHERERDGLVERLREADTARKPAWLAANDDAESGVAWLADLLLHSEW